MTEIKHIHAQESRSIVDTFIRFIFLYFTTLFSLDSYRAAANSPYRILSDGSTPVSAQNPARVPTRQRDFGEGEHVGRRIDCGGPGPRRGGLTDAGGNINISGGCRSCAPVPEVHY